MDSEPTHQSPCNGRGFYFFNHSKKTNNQPSIRGTIARTWRAFLLDTDTTTDRCYEQAVAPRPPMSEEQLKAFLAKAKNDQSIQDKLKAAKSPEEVVAIAKEHGHEFTADKITALSEEELEGVAGGVACFLTLFRN